MTTSLVLLSCAAFAAIALEGSANPFRRLWQGISRLFAAAPPVPVPLTIRDRGWQFVQCDDVESFEEWLKRDEHGFPLKDGGEPSLGSHLLIELIGCDGKTLEQEASVGSAMLDAAVRSEATVVTQSFHEFKPWGVSGAVIIQESHYTIHTWPEHGYAAVDLFYCGGTIYVHKAMDVLTERFKPGRMKFLVVRRGVQSEVER